MSSLLPPSIFIRSDSLILSIPIIAIGAIWPVVMAISNARVISIRSNHISASGNTSNPRGTDVGFWGKYKRIRRWYPATKECNVERIPVHLWEVSSHSFCSGAISRERTDSPNPRIFISAVLLNGSDLPGNGEKRLPSWNMSFCVISVGISINEYEPRYEAGNTSVSIQISVEGIWVISPFLTSFLSVTRFRRRYTPCTAFSERHRNVTSRFSVVVLFVITGRVADSR